MTDVYYVDGQFYEANDAKIPVTDLAIVRGYGIFDFLRTYNGQPFMLPSHLQRLQHSAKVLEIPLRWSESELTDIIHQALSRSSHEEANIRIIVTGGDSSTFLVPDDEPRLIVMITAVSTYAEHYYHTGAKIITEPSERYLPEAKSLNYLSAIRAIRRAKKADAVEALYISTNGNVLEGTTTNVFAIKGNTLITPEDYILQGVTRKVVLEIAQEHYTIEVRELSLEELLQADELFITSSTKEVMPIVQVDEQIIGDGKPGEATQHLIQLFKDFSRQVLNT